MLAVVHNQQVLIRYYRGDLTGAEKHFAAGFDDPVFRRGTSPSYIDVFARGANCAFLAGRLNLARDRMTNAAAAR
jgi:hypothetical protein